MVLEPAIGSFDLPFGLGRKGIGDFYIAVLQDLFPLGSGLIGQEMVFPPDGVSSLDESEDGMGVYVVTVREPVSKDDTLEGQNMSPSGLLSDQSGVKDQSTIIIQGSNQIPLFLGCRCPEMIGGVMLNQFSGITG
jgi:hypothetical protein